MKLKLHKLTTFMISLSVFLTACSVYTGPNAQDDKTDDICDPDPAILSIADLPGVYTYTYGGGYPGPEEMLFQKMLDGLRKEDPDRSFIVLGYLPFYFDGMEAYTKYDQLVREKHGEKYEWKVPLESNVSYIKPEFWIKFKGELKDEVIDVSEDGYTMIAPGGWYMEHDEKLRKYCLMSAAEYEKNHPYFDYTPPPLVFEEGHVVESFFDLFNVYNYTDKSKKLGIEKVAEKLYELMLEDMKTESETRSFRIIDYKNMSLHVLSLKEEIARREESDGEEAVTWLLPLNENRWYVDSAVDVSFTGWLSPIGVGGASEYYRIPMGYRYIERIGDTYYLINEQGFELMYPDADN